MLAPSRSPVLFALAVLAAAVASAATPASVGAPSGGTGVTVLGATVLEAIQGTWGWIDGELTCETNPHTIRLSSDGRWLTFTYPLPIDEATGRRESRYEVLGHEGSTARLLLTTESRRDAAGEIVEWDLVMLSPIAYTWRRSDWPEHMSTGLLERCARGNGFDA